MGQTCPAGAAFHCWRLRLLKLTPHLPPFHLSYERYFMKILSIDFDFFVDCDSVQFVDESIPFKTWDRLKAEPGLAEKLHPFLGPSFEKFVSHFDFSKAEYMDVWDSHFDILFFIGNKKDLEICNVDAHHDIAYLEPVCKITHVDCGNWGGALIKQGKVKSWMQVYPEWRDKKPENSFPRLQEVLKWEVELSQKKLEEIKFQPDILFICRSSAWVPPSYDAKFEELCDIIAMKGNFLLDKSKIRFPRTEDTRLLHYHKVLK